MTTSLKSRLEFEEWSSWRMSRQVSTSHSRPIIFSDRNAVTSCHTIHLDSRRRQHLCIVSKIRNSRIVSESWNNCWLGEHWSTDGNHRLDQVAQWGTDTTSTLSWNICSLSTLGRVMPTPPGTSGSWISIGIAVPHTWDTMISWVILPSLKMKVGHGSDSTWWRRCCSPVDLRLKKWKTDSRLLTLKCSDWNDPNIRIKECFV